MKQLLVVDGILIAATWVLAFLYGQYFIAKDCGQQGNFSYGLVVYDCKPNVNQIVEPVVQKTKKRK